MALAFFMGCFFGVLQARIAGMTSGTAKGHSTAEITKGHSTEPKLAPWCCQSIDASLAAAGTAYAAAAWSGTKGRTKGF